MNKKRIIIISIVVLVLILVGFVVYNIFFKPKPEIISDDFFESPEEILAEDPELDKDAPLLRLSTKPVTAFSVLGENVTVAFSDGTIGEISLGDNPEEVITDIGSKLVSSNISPQGNLVALQIDNGTSYGRWLLFNKDNGELESLAQNIRSVAFSPQGKTLLLRQDAENYSLLIRDEERESTISDINIPDLVVNWLDEETIELSTKPSGLAPSILYLLNTRTNRISRVLGSSYGLTSNMSPEKDWLLYSITNDTGRGSIFKIKSLEEGTESLLSASTLPEKCVFSQDPRHAFCASFENSPSGAMMPDDYYKGIFSSSTSTIIKVFLETGETETIEKIPMDPINLQMSKDENVIFFIDKNSKQLYRLKI